MNNLTTVSKSGRKDLFLRNTTYKKIRYRRNITIMFKKRRRRILNR